MLPKARGVIILLAADVKPAERVARGNSRNSCRDVPTYGTAERSDAVQADQLYWYDTWPSKSIDCGSLRSSRASRLSQNHQNVKITRRHLHRAIPAPVTMFCSSYGDGRQSTDVLFIVRYRFCAFWWRFIIIQNFYRGCSHRGTARAAASHPDVEILLSKEARQPKIGGHECVGRLVTTALVKTWRTDRASVCAPCCRRRWFIAKEQRQAFTGQYGSHFRLRKVTQA